MLIAAMCLPAIAKENEQVRPISEEPKSWLKDGKPIADQPNIKSKGGFGAQLFLTESTQFFEDWEKSVAPNLPPLIKARRNVPFYTAILFVNPGKDIGGAANVTCDITVRKPDGSIYGEMKNITGLTGTAMPQEDDLHLSKERMGIRIEPHDPVGTYTVGVVIRDIVKKVELPLTISFEVPED